MRRVTAPQLGLERAGEVLHHLQLEVGGPLDAGDRAHRIRLRARPDARLAGAEPDQADRRVRANDWISSAIVSRARGSVVRR